MRPEVETRHAEAMLRPLAAIVWACALLAGCADSSAGGGSGETHFLIGCETSCPGALACVCGVCTAPCESDEACGDVGGSCEPTACGDGPSACDRTCSADAECDMLGGDHRCQGGRCRAPANAPPGDAGSGSRSCPAGCTAGAGYPVDLERGCVDTTAAEPDLVCNCGEPGPPACRKRQRDGRLFVIPQLNLEPAGEWGACSSEELSASQSSCEFSDCERPPASLCSREDLCGPSGCGGLLSDDRGCRYPDCSLDADCPEDFRCTEHSCIGSSFCSYSPEGVCQCGGPASCMRARVCSPVSLAGPAGDWVSLRIETGWGPCPPGQSCLSAWVFTPDGSLDYDTPDDSGTRVLPDFELGELRGLIDGTELRAALEDGIACGPPVTDVGVNFVLDLSTRTLERAATECIFSGPEGNIFERVYAFTER